MLQRTLFKPAVMARQRPISAPAGQDGHLTVDTHGRIVESDIQAERLLGFGRAQLLGNDVGMLLSADTALALTLLRERHLARRSAAPAARFRTMWARHADGTDHELLVLVRESITARGRSFAVVLRDPASAPRESSTSHEPGEAR